MSGFIYQKQDWPSFFWNHERLLTILGKVRNLQGRIIGRMESLGFELRSEATLEALTREILKSTEIEGEILNPNQVRSSIARRLGINLAGLVPSDRNVDGVVDMMIDAVHNFDQPLTEARLLDWHYSLFPTGRSGMYKIIVGAWRDDSTGPMQVVSGPAERERVHFQAPAATQVPSEMAAFIKWINHERSIDPVIKAGIAHLWFVTIHPFEDGNGRIGRAVADMLLTRADGVSQRYYSMSSQIRMEREAYYKQLEFAQRGTLDITDWLEWFLACLLNALRSSEEILSQVMLKHKFWTKWAQVSLNDRQRLMLNKLLDGFKGKLNTSKWAKIAKCSPDTALRDIQDLLKKGILIKESAGGRSTSYWLSGESEG
ncbi:MAG: Fic family protein [Bacteroidota bacterium]